MRANESDTQRHLQNIARLMSVLFVSQLFLVSDGHPRMTELGRDNAKLHLVPDLINGLCGRLQAVCHVSSSWHSFAKLLNTENAALHMVS